MSNNAHPHPIAAILNDLKWLIILGKVVNDLNVLVGVGCVIFRVVMGARVEILGFTIILVSTISYVQSFMVIDILRPPKFIDELPLVPCVYLADQKC